MSIVYIDQQRSVGQNFSITQYVLACQIEKLKDGHHPDFSKWKVLLIGRDSLEDILKALVDPDIRVAIITQHALTMRHHIRNRIWGALRAGIPKIAMLFLDDIFGGVWWNRSHCFNGFLGTQLFPDEEEWKKQMQRFWSHATPRSTPCYWIPPCHPPLVGDDASYPSWSTRTNTLLFPSRTMDARRYPRRQAWLQVLKKEKIPFVPLTKAQGRVGAGFLTSLAAHKFVLVVVPSDGYLIRKFFEVWSVGSLPLVVFHNPNSMHGASLPAKRALAKMGFHPGTHYILIKTPDDLKNFTGGDLGNTKYEKMAISGRDHLRRHHSAEQRAIELRETVEAFLTD